MTPVFFRRVLCSAGVAVLAGGGALLATAPSAQAATTRTVQVQVVPTLAGVHFTLNGVTYATNAAGVAIVQDQNLASAEGDIRFPTSQDVGSYTRVSLDHLVNNPSHGAFQRDLVAELDVSRPVSVQLIAPDGKPYPIGRASSVTLQNSLGSTTVYTSSALNGAIWVPASKPAENATGVENRVVSYAVKSVIIRGANVVNSGQYRFSTKSLVWKIPVLLHSLTVEGNDLLAGSPAGSSVQLTYPNQSKVTVPFGHDHRVTLAELPRGTYKLKVNGGVIPLASTVRLSKNQTATEIVVTAADVAELGAIVAVVLAVLVAAGVIGRRLRRRAAQGGGSIAGQDSAEGGSPGGDGVAEAGPDVAGDRSTDEEVGADLAPAEASGAESDDAEEADTEPVNAEQADGGHVDAEQAPEEESNDATLV